MQCNNCLHKIVCKHFSYAMENLHVGIQIDGCKLYSGNESYPIEQPKSMPTQNTTVERDLSNGYTDFSSFSKENSPISAIPVEISKAVCDRCKNEVSSIDIDNCMECGRQVCNDCRVTSFDAEAGTITSICEKCWSGTEDPTPGVEKEKVSISYGEEKNEWDLKDFVKESKESTIICEEEKEDDKPRTKKVANRRSSESTKTV